VTHAQETCKRNVYQKIAPMHMTRIVWFNSTQVY